MRLLSNGTAGLEVVPKSPAKRESDIHEPREESTGGNLTQSDGGDHGTRRLIIRPSSGPVQTG